MDDHQIVMKLKKRLKDAVEAGREEDYVLKILTRLSQVSMTIEILQTTQIGRDVNGLRKMPGRIKAESKSLVQNWKKLLPAAESDDTSSHHDHKTAPGSHSATTNSSTGHSKTDSNHRDRDESHTDSRYHRSSSKRKSRSKKTSDVGSNSSMDEFSKALLGEQVGEQESQSSEDAIDFPSITGESSHTPHRVAHMSTSHRDLDPKKFAVKTRSLSPNPVSTYSSDSVSPGPSGGHSTTSQTNPRKRKADVVGGLDAVALSKRSRTQVYSGKKSHSGPQSVVSLFDMCIKVLIDNIDVIEDVGGIPFFVLEPVLSRCTATQLMRLEEFNPHFIEDSDALWEKHCQKEFKGVKPFGHQTWRELYINKLEDRETKLKNLTARISATEKARQEPIRKVMSTVATRPPGRRGTRSVPFFPGRSSAPFETKSKSKPLMKQTMKMAKQRNHMMQFKHGH